MGRAFVAGAYKERPIAKSFYEATWDEIIYACKQNLIPDNWNIGDQNTMLINGTSYVIDIIGKNHDEYNDRSGIAPLTFQLHDCYGTAYKMRGSNVNNGGWEASNVYRSYLPEILALMPSEVQAGIKEIRKITSAGNSQDVLEASSNKLFLLSEIEVFGKATYSSGSGYADVTPYAEGAQYAYYNSATARQKYRAGSVSSWWLRSPRIDNTTQFCLVSTAGGASASNSTAQCGVSFAFCF